MFLIVNSKIYIIQTLVDMLVSKFGDVSVSNVYTDNLFFWTQICFKIWYQIGTKKLEAFLVHAFQKCWYREFGNIEPDGSHWWAGLVAAIIHCGGNFWLALRHACLRN